LEFSDPIWFALSTGLADATHQDDVAFFGAVGATIQILPVFSVTFEHVKAVKILEPLHQRPFDLVLGYEVQQGRC
jgi:hypothetical protein